MAIVAYAFTQQFLMVAMVLLLPATIIFLIIAYNKFRSVEFRKLLGYITLTFSIMGFGFLLNSIIISRTMAINLSLTMSALYIVTMLLGFISALEAYKIGKIYGFL